jgi:hypothetical protein
MTSTIRVDNVAPSAGGTSRSLVRGTAAAWVNFNGTGTIAARDSENVSSLTDNGAGDYTVNFSNAFGAADYSAVIASTNIPAATTTSFFSSAVPPTASNALLSFAGSSSGTPGDVSFAMFTAHGDLA